MTPHFLFFVAALVLVMLAAVAMQADFPWIALGLVTCAIITGFACVDTAR